MDVKKRDELLEVLDGLLRQKPVWREEELLDRLREGGHAVFGGWHSADPVRLFRAHFTLFHLLYLLRDRLRASGEADLEIHCLRIARGAPKWHEGLVPELHDPLRAYYLDLKQLEETDRAAVETLLETFWGTYHRRSRRLDALAVLGLEKNASDADIRRAWRRLALRHHPDRGGDPATFRRMAEAATILKEHPLVNA